MGDLKNWANKHSKFIKFSDGDNYEGTFEGSKAVIKDTFGEEREVIRYKLDGKTFDSISISLATQMDEIQIGDRIRITRMGEGTETQWKVEKL